MAKTTIVYKTYMESKEATDYSRGRASFSSIFDGIVMIIAIGLAIAYIFGVIEMFNNPTISTLLFSLVSLIAVSCIVLNSFIIFDKKTDLHCEVIILKERAKAAGFSEEEIKVLVSKKKADDNILINSLVVDFYKKFIPASFAITGLIGCFKSVFMISSEKNWVPGLIISLIIVAGCGTHYLALNNR